MAIPFEFYATIIAVVILFILYVKYAHSYWSRKGIPYLEPTSIFGNVENPIMLKLGHMVNFKTCYDELKKRKEGFGGIYFVTEPLFMAVDPDLIKSILTKDFSHFQGRGFVFNEKHDPLAAHLLNLEGEKWKTMRVKVTPTFTSGKMKYMFQTLVDCGGPMIEHLSHLCEKEQNIDIKEIVACYTTDIIGSCAFGLECNSFKDPNAEFRSYGRKIFSVSFRDKLVEFLTLWAPYIITNFKIKTISDDVESFFINAVKSILDYRTANKIKRNDFIQIFLEMQEKARAEGTEAFTINEIAAQAFIFFLAGFETSSTTMTFCLHELSFNQEIQDKLREEVREIYQKNNGKLTYEGLMEMKYMDEVVNETLRKYPPLPILNRVCSLDYTIPGTNITLPKGTKVIISTLGIQRDEEYYPDPMKFCPERFSEENKASRPNYTFLPFGEGPRVCIGLRFGMMQAKAGLAMLLNNFKLTPGADENYNIYFDPKSFILQKKGTIMLKAEKLRS
ncbi:cytochrome p450 [Holotrichia oblita]|uniref:Cytochrome p450 n=1 Tax=Holotrichia oblita TaxID=644536 RepID=A0ACB9SXJ5_HOLOL|nr:cytochrome p450 [Holotrichia oblita]